MDDSDGMPPIGDDEEGLTGDVPSWADDLWEQAERENDRKEAAKKRQKRRRKSQNRQEEL